MEPIIIISDIAGQFDALMRLVDHFPKNEKIVLVGDLIDRGPESFEVIDWAIKTNRVTTVMANHEDMMLDYYRPFKTQEGYSHDIWLNNGGWATKYSYDRNGYEDPPAKHLDWIEKNPYYFMTPDKKLCVTHAAIHEKIENIEILGKDFRCTPDLDTSVIWNRREPIRRDYFQVFGHNSHWGLTEFRDKKEEDIWAICIDQSRKELLTAFHWPTGEIVEESYLRFNQKRNEEI